MGPALFCCGFRPFFLFGAAWGALARALWLPMLSGHPALPIAFASIDWHVHELIFDYAPAIAAAAILFIGMIQGLVLQSMLAGDLRIAKTNAPGVFAIYLRGLGAEPPAAEP